MAETTHSSSAGPRPVALPLTELVVCAERIPGVRRRELRSGDRLLVSTRNSIYSLLVCGDGEFEVAGGWFERQGVGAKKVAVNGCTAGGHALFTDLVAAPGLFLEFGDGTKTTRIRRVRRVGSAPEPR